MTMNTVVCMKWGRLYPSEYVNVLFNAVNANLTNRCRFVCLTNEPEGLLKGIEVLSIPEMNLPQTAFGKGAWPKIGVFKEQLFDFKGRILFVDLDTVINGSLDPFFENKDQFVAIGHDTWGEEKPSKPWLYTFWKRLRRAMKKRRSSGASRQLSKVYFERTGREIIPDQMGTGIFAFDAGTLGHVFQAFMEDREFAMSCFGNEQQFVLNQLSSWNQWPSGSVISYKISLRRPLGVSIFTHPKPPPKNSPVVAFHGDPRPYDLVNNWHSSYSELPHVWIGHVAWIRDYWKKYSS